jgi:two-component sensor histidine kinase
VLDAEGLLEPRTLRQRIGGTWSVAWPSFSITAGLALFALLVSEAGSSGTSSMVGWSLAWLCGTAVLAVTVLLLRNTIFRNRAIHPLPVAVVVAKDIVVAIIYTTVLVAVAGRLGLDMGVGFTERVLGNVFYAVWWSPALAYFLDYRQQVRTTRDRLITVGATLEDLDRQQDEILEHIRDDLLMEVDAELEPVRERLEHVVASTRSADSSESAVSREEWQSVSHLLRETAEGSVRPLSHRLWRSAEQSPDTPPWWSLPINIVRHQPFRPALFILIDVLGTLGADIYQYGGIRGSVLVLAGLCWSIPGMLVANALMRRYPHHHTAIFLTALLLLQGAVVIRALLRDFWIPGTGSVTWIVSQAVAGGVVILVTSGFGAWRNREAAQLDNLRVLVEVEGEVARERSGQIAILARDTAQYLHGSLQTRLIGCSLAMEQASETGDVDSLHRALAEALTALDTSTPPPVAVGSLRDEVERKVRLWDGFCDVDVRLDESLADSSDNAVIVGRVVEESVANSIRHGQASHIDIDVSRDADGRVQVSIIDNGTGPQGGSRGMGSAYLSMVSDGGWTMEATEHGTRVLVPIGPSPGR